MVMTHAGAFLIERFLRSVAAFVRDWYARGSARYWHRVITAVEDMDRGLALVITVKHLFMPLYGDYSVGGYVFGFVFRALRTLVGAVVYAFTFACSGIVYAAWVLLPPALLFVFFSGLFGFHVL